jgi:dipeptidyl aminopeptidase/acylaminoacyl peptidase
MFWSRRAAQVIAAAIFGFLIAPTAAAQTVTPVLPIEAFASLPSISDLKLSPDGKHMAALQTYKGRVVAVIYEVGAPPGTVPAILVDDKHYIHAIRWANNERLLVTIFDVVYDPNFLHRKVPVQRMLSVDTKAQNPVMFLSNSSVDKYNYNLAAIADLNIDDPDHVVMPLYGIHYDDLSYDLFNVDVRTGTTDVLVRGPTYINGGTNPIAYIMDGHGKPFARIDESTNPLVHHLLINKNGKFEEIAKFDAEGDRGSGITGLSTDGTKLIQVQVVEKTGTYGVLAYTVADGTSTVLFADPKYDIDDVLYDEWTGRVIGTAYTTDTQTSVYFDPAMQALQRGLQAQFVGSNVRLTSMTLAKDKVTVVVSSPNQPPTYYLLDRNTHLLGRVGQAYPKLSARDLGQVKSYPYKARDGLDIPAYLILPPGKDPKNLPLVVMPHGGPDSRDSMEFDWWAQFMANRGYAVFQPNFRGSSGYGRKYTEAGLQQWGLKIQDDITDGVGKLIADGIADSKRICIVGASYGGYAALAGAALTPDLYACAASYAGISDLPQLLATTATEDGPQSSALSFWTSRIGDASTDRVRLEATSPARLAEKVKSPVLLLHGTSDWTVRVDQSELMYRRLKQAGKSVEFIKFQNDDHYLERTETRIQLLTEIEKFLAARIGN